MWLVAIVLDNAVLDEYFVFVLFQAELTQSIRHHDVLAGELPLHQGLNYRFPSLFVVDRFHQFGPRILNSQIKSPYLTRKLSFLINFVNVNKRIGR